jgi:hypothetical protein
VVQAARAADGQTAHLTRICACGTSLSMMAIIKESLEIPPPEDIRGVKIRTVDDQPAVVFVLHGGGSIVVPVPVRPAPQVGRVAA